MGTPRSAQGEASGRSDVVRPVAVARRSAIRATPARLASLFTEGGSRRWEGYAAALAGVALASALVALAQRWVHAGNLSLVYLLPVLWLAARYGRGPAVVASVLAFLAYDFLFIPPLYLFSVADPTEWLSLAALLAASLVAGQLTANVRARADEARESQRRIATLYALSQLMATAADFDTLLARLAERVLAVFGPAGVSGCGVVLPDGAGRPELRVVRPEEGPAAAALDLRRRELAGQATLALQQGKTAGGPSDVLDARTGRPLRCYVVPLRSRGRVVAGLAMAGDERLRDLVTPDGTREHGAVSAAEPHAQAALFAAFRDQIALALDRADLQRQAIHAEALRESDRLKDVLLGSVTHDLRTPLASIKAAAGSLLDEGIAWTPEERRDFLESIDASADRLNRLVGNLLDLSRLEAGVAEPQEDWYLISDVIATVLDRLELAGQLRERRVEVRLPDVLPLAPMDHAQIEQVLTNLVENALKYSPAESPITITARVTSMGNELRVSVSDRGIGIPPNELEAIFGKFYRVQQVRLPWLSNRPPVGTGLGLAICAAIVQAHGGHIWAESTGVAGEGATFTFTLPIPAEAPRGTLPEMDAATGGEAGVAAERAAPPREHQPAGVAP